MKKIMFNDKYGLTQAVLNGGKTQTRRLVPNGTPIGNWSETEAHAHFKVGEVVAVAQSYSIVANYMLRHNLPFSFDSECAGWNNKMFVKAELMPHHIRITRIRIERLQDISDEDCLKEGIIKRYFAEYYEYGYGFLGYQLEKFLCTPRDAFLTLIDKVSGKGTWDSNPYVFVYDFELVD